MHRRERALLFCAALALLASSVWILHRVSVRDVPRSWIALSERPGWRLLRAVAERLALESAWAVVGLSGLGLALALFVVLLLSREQRQTPSLLRVSTLRAPAYPMISRHGAWGPLVLVLLATGCQLFVVPATVRGQAPPFAVWATGILGLLAVAAAADLRNNPRALLVPLRELLFGVTLVCLLVTAAAAAGHGRGGFPLSFLACLAAGSLFSLLARRTGLTRRQAWERLGVALLTLGAFGILVAELSSWKWTGHSDSYTFFEIALQIHRSQASPAALSVHGVFNRFGVLSSMAQAWLLDLLAPPGWAWRASNPFYVSLSVPLFYAFVRSWLGPAGAAAAAVFFATSSSVQVFSKLGYNNPQVFLVLALALACLAWAETSRTWLPYAVAGIAAGLGAFTFGLAVLVGPTLAVWLAFHLPPSSARAREAWGLVFAAGLITAAPMLLSPAHWARQMDKLSIYSSELQSTDGPLRLPAVRLFHGLTQAFHSQYRSHVASGPHADPLLAICLTAGVAALIGAVRRHRPDTALALLLVAASWTTAIGLLQPYPYPYLTWTFASLPFYALLGAVGLVTLGRTLASLLGTDPTRCVVMLAASVLPLSVGWSLYWSLDGCHRSSPKAPLSFAVAVAQANARVEPPADLVFVTPLHDLVAIDDVHLALEAADVTGTMRYRALDRETGRLRRVLERLSQRPAVCLVAVSGSGDVQSKAALRVVRESWPNAAEHLFLDRAGGGDPRSYVFLNGSAVGLFAKLPLAYLGDEGRERAPF